MTNTFFENINVCRLCNSKLLEQLFSLGHQYLSSCFVKKNSEHPLSQIQVPLTLMLCRNCDLVQLKERVDPNLMFSDYFYRSGVNPMMRDDLEDIVKDILSRNILKNEEAVLDIGCNDATMLQFYPKSVQKVGIDPAKNINRDNIGSNMQIVTDYFSSATLQKHNIKKRFKVITSIAMFYDIHNPNDFVSEIKQCLEPEGLWILQITYLPTLLANLNFYDICHEHLCYYSLKTLATLMEQNGLQIVDISKNQVNGGSLRVFVAHANSSKHRISPKVQQILQEEQTFQLDSPQTYHEFFERIEKLKSTINNFIQQEKNENRLVIALGGSTKGNVLLQYFGLDKNSIPFISERNSEKIGLKTLGTDIELISEEAARALKPHTMLVLIWFFKDEILKREKDYLKSGGALLFPMPNAEIIWEKSNKLL